MSWFPDISLLRTSWTKFDSVQAIEIVVNNEIESYLRREKVIDEPILKSFLGISTLNDELPGHWKEIYNYPEQVKLFALTAAIYTHHENIELFAHEYNKGEMQGVFVMRTGKHYTNLRSALVLTEASEKIYRRSLEVPYDFSRLFESGNVGSLVRSLLSERLLRVGCELTDIETRFIEICIQLDFHMVFGLTEDQFSNWMNGIGLSTALTELERNNITKEKFRKIKGIRVKQWLTNWDDIPQLEKKNRRKPEPFFYIFTIPALLLKRIYDVYTRKAHINRSEELYSQRKHSEHRSEEIKEFVKGGFPWSTTSEKERESDIYRNLKMPGWLPTSIIANILSEKSIRRGKQIKDEEVIKLEQNDDGTVSIILPEKIWSADWLPEISPLEIIDGQHRIRAFDRIKDLSGEYELPIVAFYNLDFTWQAYLFYTINIKPKRINTSLAYDLMPLLRIQEWLEQDANGPDIYKKVRAQELTELIWHYAKSPWHDRINMLGDSGESKGGPVSQNAFINAITASFLKKWESKIGGLFGGELHEGEQDVVQWDKQTQAAFLIFIWDKIHLQIRLSKAEWVQALRLRSEEITLTKPEIENKLDIAFVHKFSLFTSDQGIRAIFYIFNDMCFMANESLNLQKIFIELDYEKYSTDEILDIIVETFKVEDLLNSYVKEIAKEIIDNFDWRSPSAFDPNNKGEDIIRQNQNQFKGSGGYREFRRQLLRILSASQIAITSQDKTISISGMARKIVERLGL